MDNSDLVHTPYFIVDFSAVEETTAGSPRSLPAAPRVAQETAARSPRSPPAGPCLAQDPAAGPPRSLPAGPGFAQDPTVDSLRSTFVGYLSLLDPIAESPSSPEKPAVIAGAPAGVAFRPPFASPSPTLGVSLWATPRSSSSLILLGPVAVPPLPLGLRLLLRTADLAVERQPRQSQDRHLPTAVRLPSRPGHYLGDQTQLAAAPLKTRPRQRLQPALPHQCSYHHHGSPPQGLFPRPPLLNHSRYLDPLSGLLTIHTLVPALSVTPTPTGRANNAPNLFAPLPYDIFPWAHLHHHRATSWIAFLRPVAHFSRGSSPSPRKVSCTQPTMTQSFSFTEHTWLPWAKLVRLHRSPIHRHIAFTFKC